MAKKGIKRGTPAHAANVERINRAKRFDERLGYHIGCVQAMDIMQVALGRMVGKHKILSWLRSAAFWKELDATMVEVCEDYAKLFDADYEEDHTNTYGRAVFDRELAQYVPEELFCEWDVRYDTVWATKGLRVKGAGTYGKNDV